MFKGETWGRDRKIGLVEDSFFFQFLGVKRFELVASR